MADKYGLRATTRFGLGILRSGEIAKGIFLISKVKVWFGYFEFV